MQIIKAGYEVFKDTVAPVIKVEQVARVCYKSEDKIGEGTAEKMVRALVKRKHYAMIEHTSLVVEVTKDLYTILKGMRDFMEDNGWKCFIRFSGIDGRYLVSGNMRAWVDLICANYGSIPSYALEKIFRGEKYGIFFEGIEAEVRLAHTESAVEVDPTELAGVEEEIHRDLTVKFIVDRGVSHEIVRHRVASFAQESTRYCNYGTKGGEITVIEPFYLMADGVNVSTDNWSERYGAWVSACEEAEKSYLRMIADGASPQEARAVLPTSLKTEVVMTANLREWRHFFSLRACGVTGKPHPQMLEVAVPLLKEVKELIPVVFDDLEPMEV